MRVFVNIGITTWVVIVALASASMAQEPAPAFEYVLTDPAGDQAAQCTTGAAIPCDLLKFEATSTETDFVFRFTSATLTFPPTATPSFVVFRFLFTGPDGTATGVGRQISATGESNNPFPVAGGPTTTWKLERAKAQLTGTIALEDLEGAEPGAKLTPTGIQTYWSQAGTLYWTNTDTVAGLKPFEFPSRATPENLTGEAASVNATAGSKASGQLVIKNQGAEAANVTITVAGTNAPDVPITFDPANGTIEANATLTVAVSLDVPSNATAGTLRWEFFVAGAHGGNATIPWELVVGVAETPADTTAEASGDNETGDTGGEATGAAAADDAGIPGFGAFALTVAACATLVARRRRAP